jgi:putative membrane-bound dehydrogenase-like protein
MAIPRPRPSLVSVLHAAVLAAAATTQAAEFQFPSGTITVPDGFTVEVAATVPLVERPVTIDFDEQGRLYVTESSGTNIPVIEQAKNPSHRVFRLEDTDGDGVFDSRTESTDGLMMPEGSLYVAAPPAIWRFTDADDDGVAESREVWFDGKTLTPCANDLHGPYLGRDGRIYWCKGASAEQTYDLPGRPGWKTRASHIFHARDDASGIEPVLTGGMDNPVDVVFTPEGERIISCTFLVHPGGGERDGLIHALYGGVYGKNTGVLDGHARTGDLLPPLAHLGPAAASGLHRHSGVGLGEEFAGDLFTTAFNLRTVFRSDLTPSGATFTSSNTPFLQADWVDFHPTDCLEDADGSLLVVDTGGWYKLCCPTSQLEKPAVLGGIYRVRRAGAMPVADPRGRTLDWNRMTPERLATLLADPRPAVVAQATDRLARIGAAAVPAIVEQLREETAAASRQNAVWALTRIDAEPARAAVRTQLTDRDSGVRQAACHAAGLHRDADALGALAQIVQDDEPPTARAAAEALGRLGLPEACPPLLAAASRKVDRAFDHSITYALIETAEPGPLQNALASGHPAARRAALMALDQMAQMTGRLPQPLLDRDTAIALCDADDPDLRATAWWVASRHPDWSTPLAAKVAPQLARMRTAAPAEREQIRDLLAALAGNDAVAGALAERLHRANDQACAIEVMRSARLKQTPLSWFDALRQFVATPADAAQGSESIAADAITVLAGLPLSKDQRESLRPVALDALAQQPDQLGGLPERSRLQLLGLLGESTGPLPDPDIGRLLNIAINGDSPIDRAAAAGILATASLDEPGWLRVAGSLGSLGAQELSILLPALVKQGGTALVTGVEALAASEAGGLLRRDLLEAAVKALPESAAATGAALLAKTDAQVAGEREAFETLLQSLPAGDPVRGHAVFAGKTGSCTSCHAMAYVGGKIGPDLSHIGKIRTPHDLLEAIVRPSASFVRSYEPSVVVTTDGRSFQGVIREEAGDLLAVQTAATNVERVPRDMVESIEPGRVSIMPQGYDRLLSPQELADLVAFLHRAK